MNRKSQSIALVFLALATAAVAEERTPSLLPKGRTFKLVWSDEFDGDRLDLSKWSFRTNFWGKRAGWFAAPEDGAVTVKDGFAHLRIVKRADGSYCSPPASRRQKRSNICSMPFGQRFDSPQFAIERL